MRGIQKSIFKSLIVLSFSSIYGHCALSMRALKMTASFLPLLFFSMAPIKTLKIASVATLAYSIYAVRNSESMCRNWFLETLGTPEVKESGFFGKLLFPIKLPICILDMLAKKACVPAMYHQPKLAIEELKPLLKKLSSYEFIDDEEFNGKAIEFLEL
jgi:hypothetical protein